MFKNVANSLRIANKLKDDPNEKRDKKNKIKIKWPKQPVDDGEARKMAEAAGEMVGRAKEEGFLVRQSRKKFTKFVARLQNVRSLSSMKYGSKRDLSECKTKTTSNSNAKDKMVKFRFDDDEQDLDRISEKLVASYFDDSDDDDAYVSASETFEDYEDLEEQASCSKCHDDNLQSSSSKSAYQQQQQQVARSYSEDELDGNKFIMEEELCDIPTFLHTKNCNSDVIEETRRLLKERYANNPDSFYENDYKRMLADDWTVTRFLLRRRMDPSRTAKLMEECGKFRRQYLMSEIELWEFPLEFHLAGGLFKYAPDRVGNLTMYMRIKMYRRVPEISDVFKAFILCVLEQCDVESNGRGTAVVFDLSGCGLQNVDLGFLYWLLNSFRNYCPKGVSYILVYNLPWFLSATAKLAMTWMSETNRRALRFVQGKEIEKFIAPENLPDYLGGTCPINYRAIPEDSRPAVEVCDRMGLTVAQAMKIKELFKEYLPPNYEATIGPATSTKKGPIRTPQHQQQQQQQAQQQRQQQSVDAEVEQQPQQQENDPRTGSDNHSHGSSSTIEAGSVPVVELVSKASKFIATN